MPTYDYFCKDCTETFEIFQSINDDHAENGRKCPKCMGAVKRVFSPGAGLIFKGSGFYITDYKKKDKGSSESNPS